MDINTIVEKINELFKTKIEHEVCEEEAPDTYEILSQELPKILEGLDYEVVLEEDCYQYFNAPCLPREYRYFNCIMLVAVVFDKKNKKAYRIWAEYRSGYYCKVTSFLKDTSIWYDEIPLISEETTPFTARLIENIPWLYIRPTWKKNIEEMILDLAKAEIQGRLEEGIKNMKAQLEKGAWIYDYGYVLGALERTINETNK